MKGKGHLEDQEEVGGKLFIFLYLNGIYSVHYKYNIKMVLRIGMGGFELGTFGQGTGLPPTNTIMKLKVA